MNLIKTLDGVGRPLMRATLVVTFMAIGVGIGAAAIRWGVFGASIPPLPGESVVITAIPAMMSMVDNFIRQQGKNVELAWSYGKSMPNPHGGPGAP